ncbi:4Fe-4S cluster-binding domain-containing protein [Chlorobium limicola]
MNGRRLKHDIITTQEQLAEYVTLTDAEKEGIRKCRPIMPMKITRHYAGLLDRDNPDDPLRKLAIPSVEELVRYPDDEAVDIHRDEAKYQPVEGIIHRYPGKVLLMYTTACFSHCRFCFRSEKVASTLDGRRLDKAIGYLRKNESIRDVIFTGGDPMYGNPDRLEHALYEVRCIPHVEIIRITTRAPIFASEIFTDAHKTGDAKQGT